jgi:hypothetical protein
MPRLPALTVTTLPAGEPEIEVVERKGGDQRRAGHEPIEIDLPGRVVVS